MPYKIVYYDGGAAHDGVNGNQAYVDSIGSAFDRSLTSTLELGSMPAASYGTWHAVIYRAYSGDPAPASTYLAADPDSVLEIQFTVEEDALRNQPPGISWIGLYDADRTIEQSTITPQTEYSVQVTVNNVSTLAFVDTVTVTLFYDPDGQYQASDRPASGDSQNAAILTCTVGETPVWSIDSGTGSTWSLIPAHCAQPDLTQTSGDFSFHFKAGKVATATSADDRWHIFAEALNTGGAGDYYRDNYLMNWYGEITIQTPAVDFGIVEIGSDFSANSQTGITVSFICNGYYSQQIKADSPWTDGLHTLYLDENGSPGEAEFALKANSVPDLAYAFPVTTGYSTIAGGAQTAEGGESESDYTLWLKLGTLGIPAVTYNGTIYYQITQ